MRALLETKAHWSTIGPWSNRVFRREWRPGVIWLLLDLVPIRIRHVGDGTCYGIEKDLVINRLEEKGSCAGSKALCTCFGLIVGGDNNQRELVPRARQLVLNVQAAQPRHVQIE